MHHGQANFLRIVNADKNGTLLSSQWQISCHIIEVCLHSTIRAVRCSSISDNDNISTIKTGNAN